MLSSEKNLEADTTFQICPPREGGKRPAPMRVGIFQVVDSELGSAWDQHPEGGGSHDRRGNPSKNNNRTTCDIITHH